MLFITLYIITQQELRSAANEPQTAILQEVFNKLDEGAQPNVILKNDVRDMTQTLTSYVVIYDKAGTPITGTVVLNAVIPSPPSGVFEYLHKHQEERFTWEPKRYERQAVVARYFAGNERVKPAYVLVGRSLKETEKNEARLFVTLSILWIVSMLGSLLLSRSMS